MREVETQLTERNVKVAIVTFEANALAQAYVRSTDLEWPLLVDASRSLYRAYGMERGNWWNLYGFPAWGIYFKLFAKGRRLKLARSDFAQLGGDILIDPNGIVRFHHVGNGPADRPTVESILAHTALST